MSPSGENVSRALSKGIDQPAHSRSLIKVFAELSVDSQGVFRRIARRILLSFPHSDSVVCVQNYDSITIQFHTHHSKFLLVYIVHKNKTNAIP